MNKSEFDKQFFKQEENRIKIPKNETLTQKCNRLEKQQNSYIQRLSDVYFIINKICSKEITINN